MQAMIFTGALIKEGDIMGKLIHESFAMYLFLAIFTGLWFLSVGFGIAKKIRNIENQKIRKGLCVIVCSVLGFLWEFFFVYKNLYPISLAYYEYQNDKTEEVIGVVEYIEQTQKDIICLRIDGVAYTIVHNSTKPYVRIVIDVSRGDEVRIIYGENSKCIFDIDELEELP